MRLIDQLAMENHKGQIIQLFEFRGHTWRPTTGPDGTQQSGKSKRPTTILIASRSIWEAHVYLHAHIPDLVPDTITHQGDVWFASEIEEKITSE